MKLSQIEFGTEGHSKTIELRNKILRDPIGLKFTDQDLEDEKQAVHIGCFDGIQNILVGCCFFTPLNKDTVKLRQMAVNSDFQKQGIGSLVISFAEKLAKENGYKQVYLHARKEAVDFYKKHGYALISNEFIEVGIPHFEMQKDI